MSEIRQQVEQIVEHGLVAHWTSDQISLAVGNRIAELEAELATAWRWTENETPPDAAEVMVWIKGKVYKARYDWNCRVWDTPVGDRFKSDVPFWRPLKGCVFGKEIQSQCTPSRSDECGSKDLCGVWKGGGK